MKLQLFFFVALCPVLVSAQSIFDLINPFYWIFTLILNLIFPQELTCGLLEGAFESAVGDGDIITCTCSNSANVFLVVPTGVTVDATCSTNANLALNNQPSESNKSTCNRFSDTGWIPRNILASSHVCVWFFYSYGGIV